MSIGWRHIGITIESFGIACDLCGKDFEQPNTSLCPLPDTIKAKRPALPESTYCYRIEPSTVGLLHEKAAKEGWVLFACRRAGARPTAICPSCAEQVRNPETWKPDV